MSSVPYVHSAEGRNWKSLLLALGGEKNPPVSRIHLPAYQELVPSKYLQAFHMVSYVNRALLAPETLVYPELENYPYSRFSKSRAFTRFQLLSSLALNLSGMTIDLFDLNGRGIIEQDSYQTMLREVKPVLSAMNASGAFSARRLGVCVLVDERASYALHTKEGARMEELYPEEVFWAGLLPAMGVPMYIGTSPEDTRGVAAVSGQYFRNLAQEQIERLFAENFVLLSGDALETLIDLGLGHLAGVAGVCWMKQNSGAYTFEQATNGRLYTGVPNARASCVISGSDALDVSYLPGAEIEEYSALYDSSGPQIALPNRCKRRMLIYPFGRFAGPRDSAECCSGRAAEILQDVLNRSGALPRRWSAKSVSRAYAFPTQCGVPYLVNCSLDAVARRSPFFGQTRTENTPFPPADQRRTCAFSATIEQGRCTLPSI